MDFWTWPNHDVRYIFWYRIFFYVYASIFMWLHPKFIESQPSDTLCKNTFKKTYTFSSLCFAKKHLEKFLHLGRCKPFHMNSESNLIKMYVTVSDTEFFSTSNQPCFQRRYPKFMQPWTTITLCKKHTFWITFFLLWKNFPFLNGFPFLTWFPFLNGFPFLA
jgi:hypothetical protein